MTSSGFFLTSDCFKRLQVTSRSEKKAVVHELLRLHKKEIIERHGSKNGCYRRVENEVEAIDFLNAETESIDLWLPFGINEMVEIMPGNIILIAGSPNAGKTALLLNILRYNMSRFECHYFNSEMAGSESVRKRPADCSRLSKAGKAPPRRGAMFSAKNPCISPPGNRTSRVSRRGIFGYCARRVRPGAGR